MPAPAWKARFVSKSNSYKACIGSQEAKQKSEELTQRVIKSQLGLAVDLSVLIFGRGLRSMALRWQFLRSLNHGVLVIGFAHLEFPC